MSGYWLAPDDWQSGYILGFGSAHSVSSEPEQQDNADRVREVAEEVSGKPIPKPEKQRIGFI